MKQMSPYFLLLCAASMIQTAAAQTAQPASSPPVKSDVVQNGPRKFDVRARGAICDGRVTSGTWTGTDDTAAFTAAIRSFAELVIPPAPAFGSTCSIAPGTLVVPTGRNSWSLTGEGYELSTLQDNTVHPGGPLPPMLQVGNDPSKLMNSTILRGFSLSGAYGGTPSYPNGLLSLFPNNLSHIEDVWVQLPAGTNNSFGIKADGGTGGFGEMRFNRISIFCPNKSNEGTGNTGISIRTGLANTDFADSNVESCQTGVNFFSNDGTPILNWRGGHFERISNEGWGGIAFKIQQASLHAYGVDMQSGMTWLDSSSVGSEISYGGSSRSWPAAYSDSGIGNRFFSLSGSPVYAANLSLTGGEQYGTQNLFSDGQFNTCCSEWKASSGSIKASQYPFTAPGATTGQSMQVISSANPADYVSTTVNVTPNGENELLALVYFSNLTAPAPTLSVYDTASRRTIYGPVAIKPTMAVPSDGDAWAYALLRVWIPASANATTWQIQLSPHTANSHQALIVPYLALNPSKLSLGSGVPTTRGSGIATCTSAADYSSYLQAACNLSGENKGAAGADLHWTLPPPPRPSGVFLRMHVATDNQSVLPACTINGALKLILVPNASLDYNFPLPFYPTSIDCNDYFSPATDDQNVLVISQLSVVPW